MPLIVICGNPCNGKTTFANHLYSYIKEKKEHAVVELINEEALKIAKREGYKNAACEKITRGALKSEVDHKLNSESFVIIDSTNYIKGFRYELFCSARTFRTQYCVVWVECADSLSNDWNTARQELHNEIAYEVEILEDLRRRFEAPNCSNRWDNPLFKVNMNPDKDTDKNPHVIKKNSSDVVLLNGSETAETVFQCIEQSVSNQETAIEAPAVPVKSSWRPSEKQSSFSSNRSVITTATVNTAKTGGITKSGSITTRGVWNDTDTKKAVYFTGSTRNRKDQGSAVLTTEGFVSMDKTCEDVYAYLSDEKVQIMPQNPSTMPKQQGAADHLYELDRVSQMIVHLIAVHQSQQAEGTPIKFIEFDREMVLHRYVGTPELQRHRRQYVKINSQHHSVKKGSNEKRLGAEFIEFLATSL